MNKRPTNITYKDAGVDIDKAEKSVELIKRHLKKTLNPSVLSSTGTFGALYDLKEILKNYKNPVLVQSIDSVGTKLIIANMAGKHSTIGKDMVSHSCNDILCQGATPLTFLDYIAVDRLKPEQIEDIVTGICTACMEVGVAVIGGEIAELPGVYKAGEYDLVGAITGVVDKERIITGKNIAKGDAIIGLESSGLHTNGYSLARNVLFSCKKYSVDTYIEECVTTLGEALLMPHRNYTKTLLPIIEDFSLKGIAHITGGGIKGNLSRIIPDTLTAQINKNAWNMPPLFELIKKEGGISEDEMFRTFNNGIGLIIISSGCEADLIINRLKAADLNSFILGEIINRDLCKHSVKII